LPADQIFDDLNFSSSGKMPEARWGNEKAPTHDEKGRQNGCASLLIFSQANDAWAGIGT
jgi:hypothetical protein